MEMVGKHTGGYLVRRESNRERREEGVGGRKINVGYFRI